VYTFTKLHGTSLKSMSVSMSVSVPINLSLVRLCFEFLDEIVIFVFFYRLPITYKLQQRETESGLV